MSTFDIPAASFAMAKDGRLIYHRAFGNAELSGSVATQPHNLFRIASLSKPITAIAIMKMVEDGQIALTDQVFGTGGILANHSVLLNANITDSRIYDITIQNLLEHSAGWNSGLNCFPNPTPPYPWQFPGCDPIGVPLHVTQMNGTSNPATETDMIYFLLEKGLNFAPNSSFAYSNIGYLVLGEIIAEIANTSYEDYVKDEILAPLGICDMHLGKNLIADKMEREVEYMGNGNSTLSCYGTGQFVPWEYGGFNVEAMGAHGGWIATSRDLIKLLVSVDGFDSKPDILNDTTIASMVAASDNNAGYAKGWSVNQFNNWWHTGALDGTATLMARTAGGYTWAILLNKRIIDATANQFWSALDALPWSCMASTSNFPAHDLLDIPLSNSDNLTFSNITDTSVTVSWIGGSGDYRVLAVKEGDEIEDFPMDGIAYSSSTSFAAGDDLGNHTYIVYDGIENTVNVTGLQPNEQYFFRVFDYNQSTNTGDNKLYKLCGNNSATVVTNMATASNDLTQGRDGVLIYPTVTKSVLNIRLPQNELANYQIYNTAGQLVNEGGLSCQECQINIPSHFSTGLYWIKFDLGGKATVWKKFIVS